MHLAAEGGEQTPVIWKCFPNVFSFFPALLGLAGHNFVKGNFVLEKGANKHPLVEMGKDPGEAWIQKRKCDGNQASL